MVMLKPTLPSSRDAPTTATALGLKNPSSIVPPRPPPTNTQKPGSIWYAVTNCRPRGPARLSDELEGLVHHSLRGHDHSAHSTVEGHGTLASHVVSRVLHHLPARHLGDQDVLRLQGDLGQRFARVGEERDGSEEPPALTPCVLRVSMAVLRCGPRCRRPRRGPPLRRRGSGLVAEWLFAISSYFRCSFQLWASSSRGQGRAS